MDEKKIESILQCFSCVVLTLLLLLSAIDSLWFIVFGIVGASLGALSLFGITPEWIARKLIKNSLIKKRD